MKTPRLPNELKPPITGSGKPATAKPWLYRTSRDPARRMKSNEFACLTLFTRSLQVWAGAFNQALPGDGQATVIHHFRILRLLARFEVAGPICRGGAGVGLSGGGTTGGAGSARGFFSQIHKPTTSPMKVAPLITCPNRRERG